MRLLRRLLPAAVIAITLLGCEDALEPGDPALEIVYLQSMSTSMFGELRVMTPRGESRRLWSESMASSPAWSPDGRIAFVALRRLIADPDELLVIDARGTVLSRHPAQPEVGAFDWRPDGAPRITGYDVDVPQRITTIGIDGSAPASLMETNVVGWLGVRWTPAGDSLLVSRDNGVPPFDLDLWLVAADGSGARRVAINAHSGELSPDGAQVAFFERIESPPPGSSLPPENLMVMNRDGTGRRVVASRVNGWMPRWSPDGRRILYYGPRLGVAQLTEDLFLVPVSGGTPANLTRNPVGQRSHTADWRR